MSRHRFVDSISGESCSIVHNPSLGWWNGGMGVEHPRCLQLADLSPDLDAFYCTACQWNGRVSGAWAIEIRETEAYVQ